MRLTTDPLVIAKNDRVVSISAFLEVGLDGEVNSESIDGKQYCAPGGQLDFVRGAQMSKDGKSILAAYSTAVKGTVSRIVPRIEGVTTDPRADVEFVVTEYGVADLFAKNPSRSGPRRLYRLHIPSSEISSGCRPRNSAIYELMLPLALPFSHIAPAIFDDCVDSSHSTETYRRLCCDNREGLRHEK